jgi:nucleoside-diphosphate-sugar epimerase
MIEAAPDLRGQRILVTGAAGFIGSVLCRALLAAGAEVYGLVRPSTQPWRLADLSGRLQLEPIDLLNRAELRQRVANLRPRFVFHLAVQGVDPARRVPHDMLAVSLFGTHNLIEALSDHPPDRIVHVGSSTEYGHKAQPMSETDLLEPVSIHGVGKAAASLLALQAARAQGLPVVVLRLFTIYGPWESAHRFIPTVIRAGLTGEAIRLTLPGYSHDFVYVDDAVEACVSALSAHLEPGEVFNVGSGRQATNEAVVAEIGRALGTPILVDPRPFTANVWDTPHWVADPSRAAQRLRWRARHSLTEGLTQTVAWFRGHQAFYC